MPGEYSDEEDELDEELEDAVHDREAPPSRDRSSEYKVTAGVVAFAGLAAILVVMALFSVDTQSEGDGLTTSDKVADILSGAFYNSVPNQVIIPLHEDFNDTYGGERDCKIDITFNRATMDSQQFVTAVTHGHRCRVGYSVDTLGYHENYSYPDTRTTYIAEDGFPIRHIAFTACRPSRQPMPDCFTVKVSRSDLLGESG